MTLALNIILMAVIFSVVVGMLAWAIISSRPAQQTPSARTAAASRPAQASLTRGYGSIGRVEA